MIWVRRRAISNTVCVRTVHTTVEMANYGKRWSKNVLCYHPDCSPRHLGSAGLHLVLRCLLLCLSVRTWVSVTVVISPTGDPAVSWLAVGRDRLHDLAQFGCARWAVTGLSGLYPN
jgi:hypothetical protein